MIHRATKGLGTDDKALIEAICSRNKAQLRAVDLVYAEKHGKRLRDVIQSECNGDYKNFLVACVTPVAWNKVHQLKKAMDGAGTDTKQVINVLTSASAAEMVELKKIWDGKEKKPLLDALKSEFSGTIEVGFFFFFFVCLVATFLLTILSDDNILVRSPTTVSAGKAGDEPSPRDDQCGRTSC
jgi:annexin A7/11